MASSDPRARGRAERAARILLGGAFLAGFGLIVGLRGDGQRQRAPLDSLHSEIPLRIPVPGPSLATLLIPAAALGTPRTEAQPEPARSLEAGEFPSARAFLAEYYGELWPEVEQKIRERGEADLDMPYRFTPWEEVALDFETSLIQGPEAEEGLVQSKVRWPGDLTLEFLRDEYRVSGRYLELTEADLEELQALVEPRNRELTQLARAFAQRLDTYVHEKWYAGDYVRAPFTTSGLAGPQGFHSQSHGGHGWAVTITLSYEAYPDMAELDQAMHRMHDERAVAVLDYLRSRAAR